MGKAPHSLRRVAELNLQTVSPAIVRIRTFVNVLPTDVVKQHIRSVTCVMNAVEPSGLVSHRGSTLLMGRGDFIGLFTIHSYLLAVGIDLNGRTQNNDLVLVTEYCGNLLKW